MIIIKKKKYVYNNACYLFYKQKKTLDRILLSYGRVSITDHYNSISFSKL